MMHLRKRMLAMTAVVFMAVFAMLAGNIPMEDTGEKNVPDFIDDHKKTIYFGYSDDSLTSYINSAAVAFGEREDVHVIPVLLDDNSYLETINNMTIEDDKTAPDSFLIANDFLEKAYLCGLAIPIQDAGEIVNSANFPETALQAVSYQGKSVAYPFYYETSALIYNKTYLNQWVKQQEEAGADDETDNASNEGNSTANVGESADNMGNSTADAEDGTTSDDEEDFEEVVDYTNQISREGVPSTMEALLHIADTFDAPEGVEGIMEWDVSDIFYNYWFVGNSLNVGGPRGDDPSMIDINNEQTVECLEFYQSLHQFFSIETENISYESCLQNFIDGKIVFTIGGTGSINILEEAKQSGTLAYEYGYAVLPDISTTIESGNMSVTYTVAVNGYSENKELANAFAAFITDEYIPQLYDRTGKLAAKKDVTRVNSYLSVFDEAYENSESLPKLLEIGNLWLQLESMFAKIWNGEEARPLLEELAGQIESQLIMR